MEFISQSIHLLFVRQSIEMQNVAAVAVVLSYTKPNVIILEN